MVFWILFSVVRYWLEVFCLVVGLVVVFFVEFVLFICLIVLLVFLSCLWWKVVG